MARDILRPFRCREIQPCHSQWTSAWTQCNPVIKASSFFNLFAPGIMVMLVKWSWRHQDCLTLVQSGSIIHESMRNKQTNHGLGSVTDLFHCIHCHHTAFVWVGSFMAAHASFLWIMSMIVSLPQFKPVWLNCIVMCGNQTPKSKHLH